MLGGTDVDGPDGRRTDGRRIRVFVLGLLNVFSHYEYRPSLLFFNLSFSLKLRSFVCLFVCLFVSFFPSFFALCSYCFLSVLFSVLYLFLRPRGHYHAVVRQKRMLFPLGVRARGNRPTTRDGDPYERSKRDKVSDCSL